MYGWENSVRTPLHSTYIAYNKQHVGKHLYLALYRVAISLITMVTLCHHGDKH